MSTIVTHATADLQLKPRPATPPPKADAFDLRRWTLIWNRVGISLFCGSKGEVYGQERSLKSLFWKIFFHYLLACLCSVIFWYFSLANMVGLWNLFSHSSQYDDKVWTEIYVSNVQFFIVDLKKKKKNGASAFMVSMVILGREKMKKVTLDLRNWKENEIKQ